jgi:c-di-GMP-binding flagellar brake protein YcgR
MAAVQEKVAAEEMRSIVQVAALRNTPIAVTCRVGDVWQSFHSRFLGIRDGDVWIDKVTPATEGQPAAEFEAGQRIGVAFKQRHYKYVYSTQVLLAGDLQSVLGAKTVGMRTAWPSDMLQFQRRMFERVLVPSGRRGFITFWEGGLIHEPQAHMRDRLTYHGQLVDLSAGGFRVRLIGGADPGFHTGDPLGADIAFDGQPAQIRVDLQYRHSMPDEFGVTLGLQIMGLAETDEGRKTLERINQFVQEFQRTGRRSGKSRAAV